MSAARDSSQAVSLVHFASVKGVVLKSRTAAAAPEMAQVSVISADQQLDMSAWVNQTQNEGKQQLASSLKELRNVRKRFTYLLSEIEDLLKTEE